MDENDFELVQKKEKERKKERQKERQTERKKEKINTERRKWEKNTGQ